MLSTKQPTLPWLRTWDRTYMPLAIASPSRRCGDTAVLRLFALRQAHLRQARPGVERTRTCNNVARSGLTISPSNGDVKPDREEARYQSTSDSSERAVQRRSRCSITPTCNLIHASPRRSESVGWVELPFAYIRDEIRPTAPTISRCYLNPVESPFRRSGVIADNCPGDFICGRINDADLAIDAGYIELPRGL